MTHATPVYTQTNWRFECVPYAPATRVIPVAPANTPIRLGSDRTAYLRIQINETAGGSGNQAFNLQRRVNGGTWEGTNATPDVNDTFPTDDEYNPTGEATTQEISSGSFIAWEYFDANDQGTTSPTVNVSSQATECVIGFSLSFSAGYSNGDEVEFRLVLDDNTVLDSYATFPKLIFEASPSATGAFQHANYRWRNDDGDLSAATWRAAVNTPIQYSNITDVEGINLRLRIAMRYSGVPETTDRFFIQRSSLVLYYRVNGGSWGNWASSKGSYATSTHVTDAEHISTADLLLASAGDAESHGKFRSSTSTSVSTSLYFGEDQYLEAEICFQINAGDFSTGDIIEFAYSHNPGHAQWDAGNSVLARIEPQSVTGSATLSGSGTLAASAQNIKTASAAFSGSATSTAAAEIVVRLEQAAFQFQANFGPINAGYAVANSNTNLIIHDSGQSKYTPVRFVVINNSGASVTFKPKAQFATDAAPSSWNDAGGINAWRAPVSGTNHTSYVHDDATTSAYIAGYTETFVNGYAFDAGTSPTNSITLADGEKTEVIVIGGFTGDIGAGYRDLRLIDELTGNPFETYTNIPRITGDTAEDTECALYRFRNDDGSLTTATWKDDTNADIFEENYDTNIRLRLNIESAGTGTPTTYIDNQSVFFRINGGSWVALTSSSADVRLVDSANYTKTSVITQQLGSGPFNYLPPLTTDVGFGALYLGLQKSRDTEIEFAYQVLSAGTVTTGDTIEFALGFNQVTNASSMVQTFSAGYPTHTFSIPPVTGTTSLTGTASITGLGGLWKSGAAPLSGTAAVTSVGTRGVEAVSALNGTATQAAVATVEHTGVSALSGTATQAAVGDLTHGGVAAVTGTATQAAVATVEHTGVTALTGTGTQTAVATVEHTGVVALTGTAALTGVPGGPVVGAAALTATGTQTAAGSFLIDAASALSGTATQTAVGERGTSSTVAVSGTATLAALGGLLHEATLPAPLNGTGTVVSVGTVVTGEVQGQAALAASATQAATAAGSFVGVTAHTGTATLAASPVCEYGAAIDFSADPPIPISQLAAAAVLEFHGASAQSATASLAASAVRVFAGASALAGSATVSLTAQNFCLAVAALSGSATFDNINSTNSVSTSAALTGSAQQNALGLLTKYGAMSRTGNAVLAAAPVATFAALSALTGTATTTAVGRNEKAGTASLSGSAAVAATGGISLDAAISLIAAAAVGFTGIRISSGLGTPVVGRPVDLPDETCDFPPGLSVTVNWPGAT